MLSILQLPQPVSRGHDFQEGTFYKVQHKTPTFVIICDNEIRRQSNRNVSASARAPAGASGCEIIILIVTSSI